MLNHNRNVQHKKCSIKFKSQVVEKEDDDDGYYMLLRLPRLK